MSTATVLVLGDLTEDAQAAVDSGCGSADLKPIYVASADSAIDVIGDESWRAMIVDMTAPGASRFCQMVRAVRERFQTPVVALSRHLTDLAFTNAYRWGADDVVSLGDGTALSLRLKQLEDFQPSPIPATRGTAIIANTDTAQRDLLGRVLSNAGYAVHAANDLASARAQIAQHPGSLVVFSAELHPPRQLLAEAAAQNGDARWLMLCRQRELATIRDDIEPFDNALAMSAHGPPSNLLFGVNLLQPDGPSTRRVGVRALHGGTVLFRVPGEEHDECGFTYSVSEEGVFVRTLAPPSNDRVWLELHPPAANRRVRLMGRVVWTRPIGASGERGVPPGFAVQILDGLGEDLRLWRDGFASLELKAPESASVPPLRSVPFKIPLPPTLSKRPNTLASSSVLPTNALPKREAGYAKKASTDSLSPASLRSGAAERLSALARPQRTTPRVSALPRPASLAASGASHRVPSRQVARIPLTARMPVVKKEAELDHPTIPGSLRASAGIASPDAPPAPPALALNTSRPTQPSAPEDAAVPSKHSAKLKAFSIIPVSDTQAIAKPPPKPAAATLSKPQGDETAPLGTPLDRKSRGKTQIGLPPIVEIEGKPSSEPPPTSETGGPRIEPEKPAVLEQVPISKHSLSEPHVELPAEDDSNADDSNADDADESPPADLAATVIEESTSAEPAPPSPEPSDSKLSASTQRAEAADAKAEHEASGEREPDSNSHPKSSLSLKWLAASLVVLGTAGAWLYLNPAADEVANAAPHKQQQARAHQTMPPSAADKGSRAAPTSIFAPPNPTTPSPLALRSQPLSPNTKTDKGAASKHAPASMANNKKHNKAEPNQEPSASAKGLPSPNSLAENQGWLLVRSPLATNVFVHGRLAGKTNRWLRVHCGPRYIRLGVASGQWQSRGLPSKLGCRSHTVLSLGPAPADPPMTAPVATETRSKGATPAPSQEKKAILPARAKK